jgi:hypothetical protein
LSESQPQSHSNVGPSNTFQIQLFLNIGAQTLVSVLEGRQNSQDVHRISSSHGDDTSNIWRKGEKHPSRPKTPKVEMEMELSKGYSGSIGCTVIGPSDSVCKVSDRTILQEMMKRCEIV